MLQKSNLAKMRYTRVFIRMYFIRMLMLKFVKSFLRMSIECSKAHIQISTETFLCNYIINDDVGSLR